MLGPSNTVQAADSDAASASNSHGPANTVQNRRPDPPHLAGKGRAGVLVMRAETVSFPSQGRDESNAHRGPRGAPEGGDGVDALLERARGLPRQLRRRFLARKERGVLRLQRARVAPPALGGGAPLHEEVERDPSHHAASSLGWDARGVVPELAVGIIVGIGPVSAGGMLLTEMATCVCIADGLVDHGLKFSFLNMLAIVFKRIGFFTLAVFFLVLICESKQGLFSFIITSL